MGRQPPARKQPSRTEPSFEQFREDDTLREALQAPGAALPEAESGSPSSR